MIEISELYLLLSTEIVGVLIYKNKLVYGNLGKYCSWVVTQHFLFLADETV